MWRKLNILSCRHAMELASSGLDRRLGSGERLWLAIHLAMCSACRACAQQMKAIDQLVRKLAQGADAPSAANDAALSPKARQQIADVISKTQSGR
jgi:predicted anti-sigma-YlaC factor YlaD